MSRDHDTKQRSRPDEADQRSALESLTQQNAAWLLGRSPAWLRDNAHRLPRNANGSYNARDLNRVIGTDYQPAELSNADLEPLLQIAEDFVGNTTIWLATMIRQLESIERGYGAAGLAAVGKVILDLAREYARLYRFDTERTEAEIRERYERELQYLADSNSRQHLRVSIVCERCRKVRHGHKWAETAIPSDHVKSLSTCPDCE